jgi:glycosyltransferase involved in cell wall biosynthesis
VLAVRLAKRLQDRFRFVFACLDEEGSMAADMRAEGFHIEHLQRKPGLDVGCVRRLAQLAKEQQAAVIQAHQYTPFFYSRSPGWWGRRVPVMFTEHGRVYPDLPNRKRMFFNRCFLRACDRVIAVGEAVKQALIDNEGIPRQRIEVIYNGVRLEDFSSDLETRFRLRAELGISPERPVAIQVARLDGLKDHATALRTAARVREQIPEFLLLLVGTGLERPAIERQIVELKLESHIKLLGLRTDVRQLLSVADVFLLTSISEGIPVTMIEAMAARLPIVSTAVGGIAEVVVPGETGYLAAAKDDAALARALCNVLQNHETSQRMIAAAAERAARLFSESQMHEAYAAKFQEMMGVSCS